MFKVKDRLVRLEIKDERVHILYPLVISNETLKCARAPYYCSFDILWKDVFFCFVLFLFFYSAFYFKWQNRFVIDNIVSETICRFCSCALFSNMYCKINFMAKNRSAPCNFYSELIFDLFLHFFCIFFIYLFILLLLLFFFSLC